MKVRYYGALTSAFLITMTTGAVQADNAVCECAPPKVVHHAAAAPARIVRQRADAEYPYYDYDSATAVSEILARRLEASLPPQQQQPWEVAPNDAKIRFYHYDVGVAYGPPTRRIVALNDNDFTSGGVGDTQGAQGGGGAGFVDGNGQVHLANGGVGPNGPTYNDYDESFSTGSFAQRGYGNERTNAWHAYNLQNGPSNGY